MLLVHCFKIFLRPSDEKDTQFNTVFGNSWKKGLQIFVEYNISREAGLWLKPAYSTTIKVCCGTKMKVSHYYVKNFYCKTKKKKKKKAWFFKKENLVKVFHPILCVSVRCYGGGGSVVS